MPTNEVAIKIHVAVPDTLFKRPQLQAKIVIPNDSVTPETLDAKVLDNVKEVLEQQLGFDVRLSVVDPDENV